MPAMCLQLAPPCRFCAEAANRDGSRDERGTAMRNDVHATTASALLGPGLTRAVSYASRLTLAAAIAAFALLDDAVEAVIGAVLISPIDEPVIAASAALTAGDAAATARALGVVAASAVVFVG